MHLMGKDKRFLIFDSALAVYIFEIDGRLQGFFIDGKLYISLGSVIALLRINLFFCRVI